MPDCIFCKIAKGEISSAKVFEDEDVFAFLDIAPFSKGHTLVISKKHFENIFDIDEEILKKVIVTGKSIAKKLKEVLKADGIRLSQSNGKAAGQDVMHFHLHVIPRYENDGLSSNPVGTHHPEKANFEELNNLAQKIR